MTTIDELLAQGTRLHQAGQLAEADQVYRQVLAAAPRHPHALNQFGMLALQAGQYDAAIERIGKAIESNPNLAALHANLGEAYRLANRAADAATSFRRALQINPAMGSVQMLLGILLHEQRQYASAEQALREAMRLQPDNLRAQARLGLTLERQQHFSEAEACFRRVLSGDDSAEAHFRLAGVLQHQQRLDEAASEYEAVIAREPQHAEAHNNLGAIFKVQRKFAAAESHLMTALAANPIFATSYINLGSLKLTQNRLNEAAKNYRRALQLEPSSAIARRGLGQVLQQQGQFDDAQTCFQEAILFDPKHAEGHRQLGYLHALAGRYDEAGGHYAQALRLQPDFALAHSNLAIALQSQGLLDAALVEHRRATACDEHHSGLHSNLLYTLNYHPAHDAPFLFAEHLAWAERHAEPLTRASVSHTNPRDAHRRVRVGYVSPHFFDHAVTFFSGPILAAHDHKRFEIYCYSDVEKPDPTTAELRRHADHWRDVVGRTDAEVAELVRADGIDILVDLAGHIAGGNRMLLFARKPAPIQVTYLGYQNTTGMSAMDYRLTDAYSDPPGQTERYHTERLERLPTTFFCYQPTSDAPAVGPLPAKRNGFVTFGSINAFTKVTPQVLETWAELLRRVPESHLVIRAEMTESLRKQLTDTFAVAGIEPERLELVSRLPRPGYLELISRLDIALDPFPFNGHTTTCDCLWQGVPVITLSGQTYASRFGGSALATLGLHELITQSREQYIRTAVEMANDLQRLKAYRASLRDRMADSPLLDFKSFTRNLEAAYRRMWLDWCRGEVHENKASP